MNESRKGGAALILVVERDADVRELERYFLEEAGFAVVFATDGDEALAVARAQRPDLIVTEILVPGMDGLAMCRRIRLDSEMNGTRVLIFSVLSAAARAAEAGADAFLCKPLAERALLKTVKKLLAAGDRSHE